MKIDPEEGTAGKYSASAQPQPPATTTAKQQVNRVFGKIHLLITLSWNATADAASRPSNSPDAITFDITSLAGA